MRLLIHPPFEAWESFQTDAPWSQFTQSWAWGSFRAASGTDVVRCAFQNDDERWLVAAQFEFRPRRGGLGYWYAPRGPVFSRRVPNEKRRRFLQRLVGELHRALLKPSLFWRFEPHAELKSPEGLLPQVAKDGQPFAFCRTPALNPSSTRVLDLAHTHDELLSDMHQKTRYNIRVADRHGVRTRVTRDQDAVERFLSLLSETAERRAFRPQSFNYVRDMVRMLSERDMVRLRVAEHGDEIRAANLEILYGDTVTYLHGASSSDGRDVMAPYALHWDAIQNAKQEGFRWYDFWGENPPSSAMPDWKESWEGITRFKQGWGGRHVDVYGTWDVPHLPWLYTLAFLPRRMRSMV